MMLQQTQVDRVIPKYEAFIKKFPTAEKLARAELSDVLKLWSGLGYNRRAKYLWEAVRGGTKGIGPYTKAAVAVFAHNEPVVMIETNIRTVYLHHLFPRSKKVNDSQLVPYMVIPRGVASRTWYAALMDYGSYLKQSVPNPSRRSATHTTQKKFKGSDREIRGAIVRAHLTGVRVRDFDSARVRALRAQLRKEGLI